MPFFKFFWLKIDHIQSDSFDIYWFHHHVPAKAESRISKCSFDKANFRLIQMSDVSDYTAFY